MCPILHTGKSQDPINLSKSRSAVPPDDADPLAFRDVSISQVS